MSEPGEFRAPVSIVDEDARGPRLPSGGYARVDAGTVVPLAWARIVPSTSGRFRIAGADQGQTTHIVTLLEWFDEVKKGMTVVDGARHLKIIGPPLDVNGDKSEMQLFTRAHEL